MQPHEELSSALIDQAFDRSGPVKLLVIEASGMTAVDYTGSQILQQVIAGLKSRLIDVAITRLSDEGAMAEAE